VHIKCISINTVQRVQIEEIMCKERKEEMEGDVRREHELKYKCSLNTAYITAIRTGMYEVVQLVISRITYNNVDGVALFVNYVRTELITLSTVANEHIN